MPEVLQYGNLPGVLADHKVEPFRERYIPGATMLCSEQSGEGYDVFFHIPTPTAQKMNAGDMEVLRQQVHRWWQSR